MIEVYNGNISTTTTKIVPYSGAGLKNLSAKRHSSRNGSLITSQEILTIRKKNNNRSSKYSR